MGLLHTHQKKEKRYGINKLYSTDRYCIVERKERDEALARLEGAISQYEAAKNLEDHIEKYHSHLVDYMVNNQAKDHSRKPLQDDRVARTKCSLRVLNDRHEGSFITENCKTCLGFMEMPYDFSNPKCPCSQSEHALELARKRLLRYYREKTPSVTPSDKETLTIAIPLGRYAEVLHGRFLNKIPFLFAGRTWIIVGSIFRIKLQDCVFELERVSYDEN